MSFRPVPAMSIWYRAWTAASRAAPRLLALRSLGAVAMRSGRIEASLETDQRQRGARGVAALVALLHTGTWPGLCIIIDGDDPVADRDAARARNIHQTTRRFERDDFEMDGVASNNAAERYHGFIGLAGALGGIERDRDGRGDFERARHAQAIEHGAGLFQRAGRAREQCVGDIVI